MFTVTVRNSDICGERFTCSFSNSDVELYLLNEYLYDMWLIWAQNFAQFFQQGFSGDSIEGFEHVHQDDKHVVIC